jgi:hypothetical protein
MDNRDDYCYMRYEAIEKRGANEVASCLLDFVKNQ